MALQPIPSPSSGDSHSPSPELPSDGTSAHTSPASVATPLHAPPVSDEGDPSSSSTPTRAMSDLTRASSAGKGGCWYAPLRGPSASIASLTSPSSRAAPYARRTCRVRRKVSVILQPRLRDARLSSHAHLPLLSRPCFARLLARPEMRRRTRRRLVQDVPPAPHKVPGLGAQAARLDAGASASITISTPRHTLITPSSPAAPPC